MKLLLRKKANIMKEMMQQDQRTQYWSDARYTHVSLTRLLLATNVFNTNDERVYR